jgi:single-strand DNA-binding protein
MYQKIFLAGNLGRDPDLRYTPNGTAVTSFSVATNEKWTDQEGKLQERTTWWRVKVWGKQAESVNQYLSKGSQVFIEGRMDPDPETGNPKVWTGKDGRNRASFEIVARRVKFIGRRGGAASFAELRDEDIPPEAYIGEDSAPF